MSTNPTGVLVHGAFAESSSWNDVIRNLNDRRIRAIATPNALPSIQGDAAVVSGLVAALAGLPSPQGRRGGVSGGEGWT